MACDHPFSRKNKAAKRTVGWRLETRLGSEKKQKKGGVGVGVILFLTFLRAS